MHVATTQARAAHGPAVHAASKRDQPARYTTSCLLNSAEQTPPTRVDTCRGRGKITLACAHTGSVCSTGHATLRSHTVWRHYLRDCLTRMLEATRTLNESTAPVVRVGSAPVHHPAGVATCWACGTARRRRLARGDSITGARRKSARAGGIRGCTNHDPAGRP